MSVACFFSASSFDTAIHTQLKLLLSVVQLPGTVWKLKDPVKWVKGGTGAPEMRPALSYGSC